ncbi:uncharacterized protein LOC135710518 isoform X2 [Ochlerotatus camptorhynchus]
MGEMEERERMKQELREKVCQQLDEARVLLEQYQGPEGKKKILNTQYSKFADMVSDPERRLKYDTLRKLTSSVEMLISITKKPEESPTPKVGSGATSESQQQAVANSKPEAEANSIVTVKASVAPSALDTPKVHDSAQAIPAPETLKVVENTSVTIAKESPVEKEVPALKVAVKPSAPELPKNDTPCELQKVPAREVLSEAVKMKQQPQIPWRTPTRWESLTKKVKTQEKKRKSVEDFAKPIDHPKEPERLARKYKTKVKKRPAEEPLVGDLPFKKPFPMHHEQPKPLFQRRHQLPPQGPPNFNSRDPRTYGEYCQRRMQFSNQQRFEIQNQQYFKPRPPAPLPVQRPSAEARPFVVPTPVAPTRPSFRPPAPPRASVPPTVTRQPAPAPVAPKQDAKKTINPVYSKDEPIRLGKKEAQKKPTLGKPATVIPEKPKEDPKKDDQVEKVDNVAPQVTQVDEPKAKTNSDEKELSKNLMELLKGFGDEDKVKQILDVMNRKSDDEAEESKKKNVEVEVDETKKAEDDTKESPPKEIAATKGKKGRTYKRIRSKAVIDSSSEDDTGKKDENKKDKAKKRGTVGNRELKALIDNATDFKSKGYTRRTGAIIQPAMIISDSPPPKQTKNRNSNDRSRSGSSDEDVVSADDKKAAEEGDSLLTVTKSPPAKGKQKSKDVNFVYNDKTAVHYNSSYSSNCGLCSFNGSAIVDHYVYEHKQYEVFVSRVSPKMADIIRADLFLTNGTVTNEGGEDEKIRFKCYFCLTWKELSRSGWIEHVAAHTGEYRYRCTSCPVMSKTEELESCFYHEKTCLKPTLVVYNNIEFQDNHIYGFICNDCNYIQIRRVNMERHLKREHPSTDAHCSRFSIVNYKIDAKPIIDEDQVMDDLGAPNMPTVMIPFHPKAEPFEPCEIVNQPYTDDDEMTEAESFPPSVPPRRTDIRLDSIHIGSAGVSCDFIHQPFSFKFEKELQGNHISSSGESPMSPESMSAVGESSASSEAEAIIPTWQIQSVQGGFDLNKVLVKREKVPTEYDSDASDKTEDFNMSDGAEDGQKNGESSSNGGNKAGDGESKQGEGNSEPPASSGGSGGGSSSLANRAGGAAGSGGGDDGDDRKKEEFPLPFKIKVEKDEKEKKKEDELTNSENIVIKTEKPDEVSADPPPAEGHFDFVELVLDSTRIEHVAYIEHQSEILFLCLMPGCQYISKKSQDFITHISRKHNQVVWDGYCHPCQSQIVIADNCTINNELQHMLDVHARRKTPTPELSNMSTGTPNLLRIRRIPGDTLSKGDLNPPPLAPIMPAGAIIAGPSGMPLGQKPIIITSAATIAPVTMAGNTIITPTHTIPAQIRPVIQQTAAATCHLPALAPVSSNASGSSGVNASVPAMANLKLNTVRLKPWTNMVTTKNQEHCRSMLEEISLLCLYKCMSRSCAFTTNNRFFMEQHLQLHENLHNANTSGRKCWLECAYCDIIAANNNVLLAHIDAEHATCGFQCNLCFYRSRDPTNVVVHQKTYHPTGSVLKKILIMPDHLKSFGDDEWKSMQESLRKNVLPLLCTICRESFYILSAYMNHLSSHGVAMVSCQVCNMSIDKKCMARHLLLHSIGLYECVYCLFGANTKSTMALHVSNAHCSKPLYCCVRYNKKRPDGVDYPPNKIESMELKTMSCTVSPDLFKRCNYTPEQLNYKPIGLQVNQSMAYPKKEPVVNKIMSNAVATPATAGPSSSTEASNIQIQITDEAGRPLIISIPVQNARPPAPSGPGQPTTITTGPSATGPPPIQMPMISSVQGGVQSFASHKQSPLPVISSVQGMVSLPPLTAIHRNDGLPVISCVQSVAQLPPESPSIVPSANSVVPKPPALTAITPSGLITIPNIPGITITAKPITTSAMSSTPIITNVQSLPMIQGPLPMAPTKAKPPQEPVSSSTVVTSSAESKGDMYKTTVAEADTQSSNSNGVSLESDEDSRADSSKSGTPVPSPSPQPGCSKESPLVKKFSSTTQIRIDFLFKGSIDKFDRLEKKVSQMIEHTGFCGMALNVCGVEGCNSKFTDPVKLNLHLLKFHNLSNYNCFHCSDRFKTAHELITHVKTHGRHRYLCFMCDRKSHFLKMMILHVQHDHNSTDVILTYLHPKKRDIHNDLVIICPQNVTAGQLQDYANNILKEEGISEKKRFAPSEIDQLPVEEIFAEDLFCASCDYTTKIRKNLKRHLEKHNDASAVSIANLPELECMPPDEPDIMFASDEVASSATIPQRVDPIKLYQCGICKFDCPPVFADLRTHVYRTHRNEKTYNCPHCNAVLSDGFICIDKIANHLKLHGNNLYKCNHQECDYLREEKFLILAHIKQCHGNLGSVLVLREAHYTADPEWQCDLCEMIRPSRAEMVEHMTKDHKLTDNQYKCSYCAYKSSDNESFKLHFTKNHPNSEILIISLFHELPPKKIPVDQSESACQQVGSGDDKGRKFSCGIESCSFVSVNAGDTKSHFLEQHPDQTLVVFDDSAIEKEKRKRFDYFVKYVCYYCQVQCDLMDDMVEHWSKLHKEDGGGKPLMYKLYKLVRCFYCDKLSTYYDIKMHAMVNHPGQIFACVDHQNAFKCGECPYVVTGEKIDLLKHFKVYHSASKNEDPCDYMDDEFLHRMLEQNNSLYTCNHCKLTFDSRYEYENHIDVCIYAGEPSSFSLTPKSVRIRHICSCCTDVFSNEYSIAKHMRNHLAQYNCRYCKREFKQLKLLNQHQILLHNAHDKDFLLKDLSQFRSQFLKIKMLFPNGLVLSKVDAYRTVCGSVEDIINYARVVNDEEMSELMFSRSIEMPLIYENESGYTVHTICKDFLETHPSMVLELDQLSEEQMEEICEQVYLLAKATAGSSNSSTSSRAQRKRGRPRRKITATPSNTDDDDDDDDWRPDRKRPCSKTSVTKLPAIKKEKIIDSDFSASDDELLINLKKECVE